MTYLFYSYGCDGILELQYTNLGAEKNTYLKESKDIAELILHFPKIYDLQESKSAWREVIFLLAAKWSTSYVH